MDKGAIHRHSHYHADMYSVEEARSEILAKFETLDAVSVPITEAIGMVLSTNVESGIDIPPFNNCLLYTSPSQRDRGGSSMPSSA